MYQWIAALVFLTMPPVILSAQAPDMVRYGRAATQADSLALTVAAAEARTARQLVPAHADTLAEYISEFVAGAVGTEARRCVDAGSGGRIRSGDFVAAMPDYAATWAKGGTKVMWISTRPQTPRPELVVKATRLDAVAEGRVYGVGTLNAPRYPSGVYVPTAGRWMLIATAGDAWGCFIVTVK